MGYSLVPGQVWTGINAAGDVAVNVTGLTAGNILLVFFGEVPSGVQPQPTSTNTTFASITNKSQSGLVQVNASKGLITVGGNDTINVHTNSGNSLLVVVAEFTGNTQILNTIAHGTLTNGAANNSVALGAIVPAAGELAFGAVMTNSPTLSSTSQISLATITAGGFSLDVSYSLSGASTTFTWSSTGATAFAAIGSALKVPHPPTAPSNLVATANGQTEIDLTWQDNSSDETNFVLQRGPNGSSWSTVATPAANAVSYNDTPVSPGTKYYYQVAAQNADGIGIYSSPANATTAGGGKDSDGTEAWDMMLIGE